MTGKYGSLKLIECKYEKLPLLICCHCRRVGHRKFFCPFDQEEANQDTSSRGDDPHNDGDRNIDNEFLNLAVGHDASNNNSNVVCQTL